VRLAWILSGIIVAAGAYVAFRIWQMRPPKD